MCVFLNVCLRGCTWALTSTREVSLVICGQLLGYYHDQCL